MSKEGDRYKRARDMVLKQYATIKDAKGRSQEWKIEAIESDTKACKDSGLVETFVNEVEDAYNQLERAEEGFKVKVEVIKGEEVLAEVKPSVPPNNASHGIDLDWN